MVSAAAVSSSKPCWIESRTCCSVFSRSSRAARWLAAACVDQAAAAEAVEDRQGEVDARRPARELGVDQVLGQPRGHAVAAREIHAHAAFRLGQVQLRGGAALGDAQPLQLRTAAQGLVRQFGQVGLLPGLLLKVARRGGWARRAAGRGSSSAARAPAGWRFPPAPGPGAVGHRHFGPQHVHFRGHAVLEARARHFRVQLLLLLRLRHQRAVALRPQQPVEGLTVATATSCSARSISASEPSASTEASRSAVPTLPCV